MEVSGSLAVKWLGIPRASQKTDVCLFSWSPESEEEEGEGVSEGVRE